ncbi:heavy metal efflux pump, CzcA family [Desulfonatronum thiosulfatophilum]|uniref:Heavy metal efflux pump, CzcA family n=1 Tax=Desulfonatronum thiosulfatophilum TaxID=617002 RepID=A0A1G6D5I1_9BACT|nr:efflux RND transporter permease subunit [Desulfonatronum thiosulfatophilum]SDB40434.1 heavy metal efflux pump, CzcA family [Desulfonatronum thiosulfatophilum]
MIVNSWALRRQATVLTLLVILVIIGVHSYRTLPREAFPDITIPYVFVTTTYEGVAPEDMETLITMPIERKLKGLAGVEEIRASSAEGLSTVAVKFIPSVDIDDALQKVRVKVDQAKADLPSDLEDDPVVEEVNFSDIPVIRVVLSGPYSLARLKTWGEDLKDRIETIPGVLNVLESGGLDREIRVEFDLDRIRAYNVPFSSMIQAVTQSNVNMPGGSMDIGETRYLVRVPEDFKHPAEIFSIVAFVRDGKPVYLRDVARIEDTHKDPLTRSRINGRASVTLSVQKRSGENIVRICDEVRALVAQAVPDLPPDLQVDITSDMSEDVREIVADLENNILTGLILVLAVILAFIGGRSAIFVALAIPYSMFIGFALLAGFGITLNMVVLFSLILALGMLVDNGIVIVENIYRHMQEGRPREVAARIGTDQVAWPVITATLTTLSAFIPLLFWPGIVGEFMKFLPKTLIMVLSASLFVALVVNPVLSARYQTVRRPKISDVDDPDQPVREVWVKRAYLRLLEWSLGHRLIVLSIAVLLLAASMVGFGIWGKGVEFFPETDPNRAFVHIRAPEGTSLDASDRLVAQVEEIVMEYDDIKFVIANIGSAGGDPFSAGGPGTHLSRVALDFVDFHDRSRSSAKTLDEIRERVLAAIAGAEVQVEAEEGGPPTGPAVNMEISGRDIHVLGELAAQVRRTIRDVPGLVDLKDNFVHGRPEIRINVNKEKAALLGLDTYTIAYTVKAAVGGVRVGVLRDDRDEYDITARLPEEARDSLESLKRLTVSGPLGEPIPLTSVAEVELGSGVGDIMRLNQRRVVTVSASVSGRLANDVLREIELRLADFEWPRGYTYQFTGEQEEQAKAQEFLSKAFMAVLFLIFLILITQFNSIIPGLIILASVLFSLIGVFLGLLVTGTAFGIIMTGIGVISLAGVVVNNAIVLIDYYMQLLARGMERKDALLRAGMVRFRPVMLTAITTILGLMPMATGVSFDFRSLSWSIGGESAQWWGPMAVAVVFGLAVATLLTLVVVPVLCSLSKGLPKVAQGLYGGRDQDPV